MSDTPTNAHSLKICQGHYILHSPSLPVSSQLNFVSSFENNLVFLLAKSNLYYQIEWLLWNLFTAVCVWILRKGVVAVTIVRAKEDFCFQSSQPADSSSAWDPLLSILGLWKAKT